VRACTCCVPLSVLQALPDVRACNLAAQTLSGEVSQLELQLKYKKAELKQSQEERTKLQVRRFFQWQHLLLLLRYV
jgi:hypothetical protein